MFESLVSNDKEVAVIGDEGSESRTNELIAECRRRNSGFYIHSEIDNMAVDFNSKFDRIFNELNNLSSESTLNDKILQEETLSLRNDNNKLKGVVSDLNTQLHSY